MFIPNATCFIRRKKKGQYDAYGQTLYGPKTQVRFSLVRFDTKTEDSTVRADSSATRGNIKEYHSSGRILFPATVAPVWGDIVVINGKVFRVKEIEPRYNVLGKLDHYEVDLEKAEDTFNDEAK